MESEEIIERRIRTQRERFAAVLGARPPAKVFIESSTDSEGVARFLEGAMRRLPARGRSTERAARDFARLNWHAEQGGELPDDAYPTSPSYEVQSGSRNARANSQQRPVRRTAAAAGRRRRMEQPTRITDSTRPDLLPDLNPPSCQPLQFLYAAQPGSRGGGEP